MGVVFTRLVFLAFIGLTGFIIYNALYLQEQRGAGLIPTGRPNAAPIAATGAAPQAAASSSAPDQATLPAVTTDLPPVPGQGAPTQLVTAIQRELAARGYGGGKADGALTLETRKAITDFEKDHGLPPTGKPSDELLRHILLGDADSGTASTGSITAAAIDASDQKAAAPVKPDTIVQGVQRVLADLGYSPGPADGAMGTGTQRAVSAFQRDRKIAATGTITPELLREIKRVSGRELASETATR